MHLVLRLLTFFTEKKEENTKKKKEKKKTIIFFIIIFLEAIFFNVCCTSSILYCTYYKMIGIALVQFHSKKKFLELKSLPTDSEGRLLK